MKRIELALILTLFVPALAQADIQWGYQLKLGDKEVTPLTEAPKDKTVAIPLPKGFPQKCGMTPEKIKELNGESYHLRQVVCTVPGSKFGYGITEMCPPILRARLRGRRRARGRQATPAIVLPARSTRLPSRRGKSQRLADVHCAGEAQGRFE